MNFSTYVDIPIDIMMYIQSLCNIETKIVFFKAFGIIGKIYIPSKLKKMIQPRIQSKSSDIKLIINRNKAYNLWKCPYKKDILTLIDISSNKISYLEQHVSYCYSSIGFTGSPDWIRIK